MLLLWWLEWKSGLQHGMESCINWKKLWKPSDIRRIVM